VSFPKTSTHRFVKNLKDKKFTVDTHSVIVMDS